MSQQSNLTCNICLDEKGEKEVKNCIAEIRCNTCNSGYVCCSCIADIDPRGSIFLDNYDDVADVIRCPCCRTLNWNYHYNQLVATTLGYDPGTGEGDWDDRTLNAAQRLFLHNSAMLNIQYQDREAEAKAEAAYQDREAERKAERKAEKAAQAAADAAIEARLLMDWQRIFKNQI